MVKVWDYEAQKASPLFFQAFIGHICPVQNIKFLKDDNSKVVSAAGKDGVYVWSFYGDTETNFAHELGSIKEDDEKSIKS